MGGIGLERKSSIELEPLTLSLAELKHAREAAMCILKNNPLEEAIKIFTEGLHPVPMMRDSVRVGDGSEEDEEEGDEEEEEEDGDEVGLMMDCAGLRDPNQFFSSHRTCFCPRDTATAPF